MQGARVVDRREAANHDEYPRDVIRVMIVDDHGLLSEGLRRVLDSQHDVEVVGTVNAGNEAIARAASLRPDVAIVDVRLPDVEGPEVTAAVLDRCPGSRVLILTGLVDDALVLRALEAGATGLVTKDCTAEELIAAVHAVAAGSSRIPALVLSQLITRRTQPHDGPGNDLTPREREVLARLCAGQSAKRIAAEKLVSAHTVRNHIRNILVKLGVHSQLEAVAVARRLGLDDAMEVA